MSFILLILAQYMEVDTDLLQKECFNCDSSIKGVFCHNCGQRIRDNSDRSLSRLLGEVFNNVFFFDNRFFISIGYLIRFPGRMTVEFLEGKRKKFISPVTLFLFVNLVYFLVNPLSDYSISLYDQIYAQPYSGNWIKELVISKIQNEGLNEQAYIAAYQNTSDNISKSIMILNVPLIALFVYLMSFKRRRFYFDSLIFAFHFFTLFLISWISLDWADVLIDFLHDQQFEIVSSITFHTFTFGIPFVYAILSINKFMNVRWYWSILIGFGIMLGVLFTNFFYRLIIFFLTFWTT